MSSQNYVLLFLFFIIIKYNNIFLKKLILNIERKKKKL